MYRRQLLSNLSLICICFMLLGTGFFTLYYQYHLNELKTSVEQDAKVVSGYASSILQSKEDIYLDSFHGYLSSVSTLSNLSILLCEIDGSLIFATGNNLGQLDPGTRVPPWAVQDALSKWTLSESSDQRTFPVLTTFGGIFPKSSFVTSVPILSVLVGPSGAPIAEGGEMPVALIFIATEASYVKGFLLSAMQMFLITAAAVLLISMFLSTITAQHLVQPLRAMATAAYRFARGDLNARVTGYSNRNDEVGDLARAFNIMVESLDKSESRRSEFVANVSHELKTPMTTIAGFADGILDGTIPPERQRESLEIISSETRRLSRLVRRMLELSRLQSSDRVAAQVQFDISEMLLRVLLSLEAKVTEKELEVVTNLPEAGVMVWGEPDAATQVCYNLLDNAIKFSKQGGVLTLGIRLQGGKAFVSIKNQGNAIPPEQLAHIFERFHKADSARTSKDGVGLGLYIVKTLLNTYNEDITVTSENGETEFTFTLSEV